MNIHDIATRNFAWLVENDYVGRGIVLGLTEDGKRAVQVYWIMGRSENSQNRIFESKNGVQLRTAACDPSKVEDSSLIIYLAMDQHGGIFPVTNGDQTVTIIDYLKANCDLQNFTMNGVLREREFEPDKDTWTPRINGQHRIDYKGGLFTELGILKRSEALGGKQCQRSYHEYDEMLPGLGVGITTYNGNGKPLPAFTGEPRVLPILGEPEDILNAYWGALNSEFRVSIAIKAIDIMTGVSTIRIINRFSEVTK